MKRTIAAGLVALVTLAVPVTSSAQGRYYGESYRRSSQCERRYDYDRRATYQYERPVVYDRYRASDRYYVERHRRSRANTALVIAGSAATGAGIGGAIRGGRGALIGAAIGGGVASIYEAARHRR
jgi:hypothetical protein